MPLFVGLYERDSRNQIAVLVSATLFNNLQFGQAMIHLEQLNGSLESVDSLGFGGIIDLQVANFLLALLQIVPGLLERGLRFLKRQLRTLIELIALVTNEPQGTDHNRGYAGESRGVESFMVSRVLTMISGYKK